MNRYSRNEVSSKRRPRRRKRSASNTQILKINHGLHGRRRVKSLIGLSRESNKENTSTLNEWDQLTAFFRKNKQFMNCNLSNRILKPHSNRHRGRCHPKRNGKKDKRMKARTRSGSFSQSAALYNRTDESRLLHKLQNERFHIKRDPCSPSNHHLQFTIGARDPFTNTHIFKQWIKQYRSDKQSFRSIETFAIMKLNELSSNEGKLRGVKNRLKTAVCCDLVQDLMDSHMMSISPELKHQLKVVLFQSIYTDLPIDSQPVINIKHFVAAMPFYILSRRMVKELERTPLIDPENELNMKTLRGAMSIKEKCELLAALKKDKQTPIEHIFAAWKNRTILRKRSSIKAIHKLRRFSRVIKKANLIIHFDAWRAISKKDKEAAQQQRIFQLMRQIKKVKAEHNMMVASLRKAEEKKKHLRKMLVQQQRKTEMAPFLSPEKLHSQQQFERQLEELRTLQNEFNELPHQLVHAGIIMDNPNQDLSKLFDEEIALQWLEYQLKQILHIIQQDEQRIITQMEERKKYDHDGDTPDNEHLHINSSQQDSVAQSVAVVTAMLSPRGRNADMSPSISRVIPMSPRGIGKGGKTDVTDTFVMVVEQGELVPIQREVTMFSTPHNKGDDTLTIVNFRKMKRIIRNLLDSGLDDFDHDFQGGTIWLILHYFLFNAATFQSFRDLLNLIKFANVSHPKYGIIADKLVSLCTQYLTQNDGNSHVPGTSSGAIPIQQGLQFFITAAQFQSNSNILNFVLLLKFCLVAPNLTLQTQHIHKTQLRIESSMGLIRAVMSKLSINISNDIFHREMKNVDQKIKEIRGTKDQLWNNHRKWTALQNRFDNRLTRELHNYQRGKITFLYEPSYPHYIIQHITHIPLPRVHCVFARYHFPNDRTLRTEFGLTLKAIKEGMGIIYALLKKYSTSNGTKLTFLNYDKMIYDLQLINDDITKRNAYILHQLFVEICEFTESNASAINQSQKTKSKSSRRSNVQNISGLQCYDKFTKSVSESFHRGTAQLMAMDLQYFGVLLVYLAEIRYFKYSKLTPSIKLSKLLKHHLLPLVHPKSHIIAISNLRLVRLVRRQKAKQLQQIWVQCTQYSLQSTHSTASAPALSALTFDESTRTEVIAKPTNLVDTVTVDSVIKALTPCIETTCYSHLVKLCQTCADYQDHTQMDDNGLFQVICFVGQMNNAQNPLCIDVDQSIARFIDRLTS